MVDLSNLLLKWYRQYGRDLPWRVKGKAHSDPYAVWVSEIMLQQTTVKTVIDYYHRWMKRFPTLSDLAQADIQDVLLMWQGLGYYTRAKKLHECAIVLMNTYNGLFPHTRNELLKLPGIGPYTASSICAFAFNQPETVVDGNVIRVIARLYGITQEVQRDDIYHRASLLTPQKHGADYASAIMDLGAMICTPTHPRCSECPWNKQCVAYRNNLTEQIPLIQKPVKQERIGTLYLIQNQNGDYYIQKRLGKGLLSGLYEFPWSYESVPPVSGAWEQVSSHITHTFTHFHLTLKVQKIVAERVPNGHGVFVSKTDFSNYPFSTLMKKVFKIL